MQEFVLTNNFYALARAVLLCGDSSSMVYSSCIPSGTNNATATRYFPGPMTTTSGTGRSMIRYHGSYDTSYPRYERQYFGQMELCCITNMQESSDQAGYVFIRVGSGNTLPTRQDTELAQRITSGIQITGGYTHYEDVDTGKRKIVYTVNIRNTSSNEQIVREVGLYKALKPQGTTTLNAAATEYILLGRVVLDSPLVLQANEMQTIQLCISL